MRFLLATSLFFPFTLAADYKTCMDYCMTQHNFDRCHATCTGETIPQPSSRQKPSTPKPSTTLVNGGKCETTREKKEVIKDMLLETYGRDCRASLGLFPSVDEPQGRVRTYEIYCYPEGLACGGILVVEDSCEIAGELECGPDPEAE